MANTVHDRFGDFDFRRARWMIEVFDEACRNLPNAPSAAEREVLATGIIRASRLCGWDRIKLRDFALAYLHAGTERDVH